MQLILILNEIHANEFYQDKNGNEIQTINSPEVFDALIDHLKDIGHEVITQTKSTSITVAVIKLNR